MKIKQEKPISLEEIWPYKDSLSHDFFGVKRWPLRWVIHIGEETHPERVVTEIANICFWSFNTIRTCLMGCVGPGGEWLSDVLKVLQSVTKTLGKEEMIW